MYRKVENSVYAGFAAGWFIGCQVLIIGIVKFLVGEPELFLEYYNQHMYKINLWVQIVCMLGFLLIDSRVMKSNFLSEYKDWQNKKVVKYIFYGIGFWLVSTVVNGVLIVFFSDYSSQIQTLFMNEEKVARFMVLVVFAPLVEEYVFRGKIQARLKTAFGAPMAIVIQGVCFGLIHAIALQKIYASLLGIGFGIVKEKEKNLQSSTVMHMTINLIGWTIGTFINNS
ncbi:MAG: family intrarane metalloprotease [Clostridia bacterium]|jgi:membrane protease YdiL (CAAX protease family)|nr:family intrarane metalloprotease [Clostridia bacterium]